MKLYFKVLLMLAFSKTSFAGWSSGGGELLKDSMNPWFLTNTKTVTYCVIINQYAMTVGEDHAEKAIQFAIRFWKREFAAVKHPTVYPAAAIATQTFKKIQCDPAQGKWADISFQYGFLTKEQREYLGDLQKHASIAVRTEYDLKKLKARGFIYFAAEYGNDRLVGNNLVPQPWTRGNGGILHWATLHELGHVFGVQHTPATQNDVFVNFMATDFVEKIVRKHHDEERFYYVEDPGYYFKYRPRTEGYGSVTVKTEFNIRRKFFGIPANHEWLHYIFTKNGIDLYSGQDHLLEHADKLGVIANQDVDHKVKDRIKFYNPSSSNLVNEVIFRGAPGYIVERIAARYRSADGRIERPIFYTLDPREPMLGLSELGISAEMDGKFYANILDADFPM